MDGPLLFGVLSRKMAPSISYSLAHPLVSVDVLAPGKERKHGQPGFRPSSIKSTLNTAESSSVSDGCLLADRKVSSSAETVAGRTGF